MAYRLVIAPRARDQLQSIYDHISGAGSAEAARRFTDGIVDHLSMLSDHPLIGAPRNDLRAGLRTFAHRRRVTVAYVVEEEGVIVIGIYYGGQDFEAMLRDE